MPNSQSIRCGLFARGVGIGSYLGMRETFANPFPLGSKCHFGRNEESDRLVRCSRKRFFTPLRSVRDDTGTSAWAPPACSLREGGVEFLDALKR